jgi:hypothetical protein
MPGSSPKGEAVEGPSSRPSRFSCGPWCRLDRRWARRESYPFTPGYIAPMVFQKVHLLLDDRVLIGRSEQPCLRSRNGNLERPVNRAFEVRVRAGQNPKVALTRTRGRRPGGSGQRKHGRLQVVAGGIEHLDERRQQIEIAAWSARHRLVFSELLRACCAQPRRSPRAPRRQLWSVPAVLGRISSRGGVRKSLMVLSTSRTHAASILPACAPLFAQQHDEKVRTRWLAEQTQ